MLHAPCPLRGALLAFIASLSLSACAKEEPAAPATSTPAAPEQAAEAPDPHEASADPVDDSDAVSPAFEQRSRIAPTVTLTEADADAGRTVTLAEDEVLEVRLPADRESGYTWIPAQHLLPVLRAYGIPEYEANESAEATAANTEIWRFIAEETGTAELVFEYRKPLGDDEPVKQTLVFRLQVE